MPGCARSGWRSRRVVVPFEDHSACSSGKRTPFRMGVSCRMNSRAVIGLLQQVRPFAGPLRFLTMGSAAAADDVRREPRPAGTLPLHARGQCPGRSPGKNSPQDCLCPGSLPRHRPSAAGSSSTSAEGHPLSSAGSGRGVRSSNTKALARWHVERQKNRETDFAERRQRAECGRARGEQVGAIDCVARPDELQAELGPSPHLTALSPMTPRQIARCRPSADLSLQRHGLRTGTA